MAVTNIMGLSVEINNRGANTPCPTKEKRTRWHKTKRKIWYSSGKWKQNFKLPCIKSTKKNVYERRSKKCDNEILRSRTHSQHTQNLSRSIRWYIMSGICINFFLHTILLSFFRHLQFEWKAPTPVHKHTLDFIRPLFSQCKLCWSVAITEDEKKIVKIILVYSN